MRVVALLTCVFVLVGCRRASDTVRDVDLRDGDIIFHTSKSGQSIAIQRATRSRYSHMGMIVHRSGKPFVLEAIATVRYTPLAEWIKRGEGEHFVVKRLTDTSLLGNGGRERLLKAAGGMVGRPYDLTFEWSDARIYCSELVWKAYHRALNLEVGNLATLGQFDLSDPAVKKKLSERYGASIPLRETVIAPDAMFNSALLSTVYEGD